jgi:hypothetical protein
MQTAAKPCALLQQAQHNCRGKGSILNLAVYFATLLAVASHSGAATLANRAEAAAVAAAATAAGE